MPSKVRIVDLPGFTVDSHGNGWAYEVQCGQAGEPMQTFWTQDDAATELRATVDTLETAFPDRPTHHIWLDALDSQGFFG